MGTTRSHALQEPKDGVARQTGLLGLRIVSGLWDHDHLGAQDLLDPTSPGGRDR